MLPVHTGRQKRGRVSLRSINGRCLPLSGKSIPLIDFQENCAYSNPIYHLSYFFCPSLSISFICPAFFDRFIFYWFFYLSYWSRLRQAHVGICRIEIGWLDCTDRPIRMSTVLWIPATRHIFKWNKYILISFRMHASVHLIFRGHHHHRRHHHRTNHHEEWRKNCILHIRAVDLECRPPEQTQSVVQNLNKIHLRYLDFR